MLTGWGKVMCFLVFGPIAIAVINIFVIEKARKIWRQADRLPEDYVDKCQKRVL